MLKILSNLPAKSMSARLKTDTYKTYRKLVSTRNMEFQAKTFVLCQFKVKVNDQKITNNYTFYLNGSNYFCTRVSNNKSVLEKELILGSKFISFDSSLVQFWHFSFSKYSPLIWELIQTSEQILQSNSLYFTCLNQLT